MIKVLIADDHRIFREGIISLLEGEKDIEIVAEAKNGQEVLNLVKGIRPDVILMDVEMPEKNGLETTKILSEKHPTIKVMALSMHTQSAFVKQMLKAGASGYVQKDIGRIELIKAIHSIVRDGSYFTSEMSRSVMLSLKDQSKIAQITPREKEIIQLIVDQHTTPEIARKLHISVHTVESHRQNILLKLELKNTVGLVKYVLGKGIL